MPRELFRCAGGALSLPDAALVLVDARDGGNLIVDPSRPVWERSELLPDELGAWAFLVAAAGRAMLDTLPQLAKGCVNYWEAGNWALNEQASPVGPKTGPEHRRVHMHLLGRSRTAASPSWRWGEAPRFPEFAERHAWAREHRRLAPDECVRVVARTEELLLDRYGFTPERVRPWAPCPDCGYPSPGPAGGSCGCVLG